jgi:hypothetical protein
MEGGKNGSLYYGNSSHKPKTGPRNPSPPLRNFQHSEKSNQDDSDQTETNRKNLTSHLDNFVCLFQIF